jgi:copper chaperone CopZ
MNIATKTALKLLSAALLVCFFSSGCFRNDVRTEVFEIRQLQSEKAAQHLRNAVQKLPGIQNIHIDLQNRELTVVFDGLQLYVKNIEDVIVQAGFDLPNWPAPASAKAKLPKELR